MLRRGKDPTPEPARALTTHQVCVALHPHAAHGHKAPSAHAIQHTPACHDTSVFWLVACSMAWQGGLYGLQEGSVNRSCGPLSPSLISLVEAGVVLPQPVPLLRLQEVRGARTQESWSRVRHIKPQGRPQMTHGRGSGSLRRSCRQVARAARTPRPRGPLRNPEDAGALTEEAAKMWSGKRLSSTSWEDQERATCRAQPRGHLGAVLSGCETT